MELLLNIYNSTLLFNLLFIICLSIILERHIEPLEYIKYKLGLSWDSRSFSQYYIINIILKGFKHLLNCGPCISMWITFFSLGMNFYSFKLGIVMYILTYIITNKINSISL